MSFASVPRTGIGFARWREDEEGNPDRHRVRREVQGLAGQPSNDCDRTAAHGSPSSVGPADDRSQARLVLARGNLPIRILDAAHGDAALCECGFRLLRD
jgi:hypothetical protein